MSKFVVGQRVRCIDAGQAWELRTGAEYVVLRLDRSGDVHVSSDGPAWIANRFEAVTTAPVPVDTILTLSFSNLTMKLDLSKSLEGDVARAVIVALEKNVAARKALAE